MGGKKRVRYKETHSDTHTNIIKKSEPEDNSEDKIIETKTGINHHVSNETQKKRHIVKRVLRIHHDFPPGIAFLLTFSFIMCAIYIILASMFSFTMVLGFVIEGALSRLINIFIIITLSFMIFGISKKKIWAYHLAMWVFSITILNSLVSMFFIKKSVSGSLNVFATFSFFLMVIMNLITIWYLKRKKNYFLHHYLPTHMASEDKKYVFGITSLWLMFMFMTFILVNSYYVETTQKVDILMNELEYIYPYEAQDYCINKAEDRDLCFLTSAIVYEKSVNQNTLCRGISSRFYRYTCFKAIQGDII